MTNRPTLIASLCAIASTVVIAQRQLTIPEAVERMRTQLCRSGVCEQYATSKVRELAPHPFERAVRESDFIVVGSLKKIGSYLSKTETELYTDYELTPTNVLAQRALPVTRTVTAPQRLLVQQWGGETVINGIPVIIKDEPFPPLPTNTPVLLLLKYDAPTGKYHVYDGGTGAFAVEGGALRHLLVPETAVYERFKGMNANDAIREIHQLGR